MKLLRILPGVLITISVGMCAMTLYQGSSTSPEVAALLKGPGAVSIWQESKMALAENSATSRISPLVAQAQIYARLLNPAKPAKPVTRKDSISPKRLSRQPTDKAHPAAQAMPPNVSPQFKVHATSVFSKHPERSMALISKPGTGLSWIRPGDMLGYLRVVEIRKDAVVYAYEDTMGEVAWESGKMPASKRAKQPSSTMAMDLPELSTDPVVASLKPASPLPSQLAAPVRQMYSISPRPRQGAR